MHYPVNTNTLQAVSCQIGSRNNQSGPYTYGIECLQCWLFSRSKFPRVHTLRGISLDLLWRGLHTLCQSPSRMLYSLKHSLLKKSFPKCSTGACKRGSFLNFWRGYYKKNLIWYSFQKILKFCFNFIFRILQCQKT